MKGRKINIGAIILSEIYAAASKKGNQLLPFPSLITGICINSRAPTLHGDIFSKKTDGCSHERIMRIMDVTAAQLEAVAQGTPAGPSTTIASADRQYRTDVALATIANSLIRVETQ